jgi:hypothetical protein
MSKNNLENNPIKQKNVSVSITAHKPAGGGVW